MIIRDLKKMLKQHLLKIIERGGDRLRVLASNKCQHSHLNRGSIQISNKKCLFTKTQTGQTTFHIWNNNNFKILKMLQSFGVKVFQQTTRSIQQQQQEEFGSSQLKPDNSESLDDENDNEKKCDAYERAVIALNTLQSNAETLRISIQKNKGQANNSLVDTEKYLVRSGLTIEDLTKLSYIHVSGTKGKGSTCALTESILRSYGYKTGFFSSPHLISVTERIRLNGEPISKQKFAEHFWKIYHRLQQQRDYATDMPGYFKFLTILCFHIFLNEQVNVAILEVGIGGELDCTNIVPNTKTVGITSLGLEHTQLLGNTLEEIAWQKAGIIKPYAQVYTSVTRSECLRVLEKRANEKHAYLHKVPGLALYFPGGEMELKRQNFNLMILLNASLAIQLAYDWLRQNSKDNDPIIYPIIKQPQLTEQAQYGLKHCHWPGRCQIVKFLNFNMHLDGAHTAESMLVCSHWFAEATQQNTHNPKILLFNTTGNRDSQKLLKILHNLNEFQLVCFMPNIATQSPVSNKHQQSPDNNSVLYTQTEQLQRVQMHSQNWQNLCLESQRPNHSLTFPTLISCFEYMQRKFSNALELDILVTGSLHLLGATILSLNEFAKELEELNNNDKNKIIK